MLFTKLPVFARFIMLAPLLVLAACAQSDTPSPMQMAMGSGYWRPISSPNILMPVEESQAKLEFDHSQCRCGIFPKNIPTPAMARWQADQQRLIETSTHSSGGAGCAAVGQAVFAECMRGRGWEPTMCAGKLPLDGGVMCQ